HPPVPRTGGPRRGRARGHPGRAHRRPRRRHGTPRPRRRPRRGPGRPRRRPRPGRAHDRHDPHPRPRRPGRAPARRGRGHPRQLAPLALVRPEPPACRRRVGVTMTTTTTATPTTTYWTRVDSPVGTLLLTAAPTGELTSLS